MLKSDRFITLDIGDSCVKIAEFSQHGSDGIELLNYGFSSLGLDPQHTVVREAVIAAKIQQLLNDYHITPGETAVTLTGQSVFSRVIKLPPVDEEKIPRIMQYEAVQHVPFPIDEVVWDYQLIKTPEGADGEVLLVAVKSDIVESLVHAVKQAGLFPKIVDVSPIAVYNAVRYNYENINEPVLVVDIGARSSNLIFLDGSHTFMRSLPVAGNSITRQVAQELDVSFSEAEKLKIKHAKIVSEEDEQEFLSSEQSVVLKSVHTTMNRLYQEISRSITFYRNQQEGEPPKRLLLTGGTARIPGLGAMLEKRLHCKVELFNPLKKIKAGLKGDSTALAENASQFGELVGLALRYSANCPIEITLMPDRLLKEQAFVQKQPVLLACAAGLILIVGIWAFGLAQLTHLVKKENIGVAARVRSLSQVENKLKAVEAELKRLTRHRMAYEEVVKKRTFWLRTFMDLQSAMPDGMFLTSVKPLYEDGPEAVKTGGASVHGVRIAGISYLDKELEGKDAVKLFWKALCAKQRFSEKSRIVRRPTAKSFAREFVIDIIFETPVKL